MQNTSHTASPPVTSHHRTRRACDFLMTLATEPSKTRLFLAANLANVKKVTASECAYYFATRHRNAVHRRAVSWFCTAIRSALDVPISTTSFLPRVSAV